MLTGSTVIKTLNISIPLTPENMAELEGIAIDVEDIKNIIKRGFFGFAQGNMTIHRDKDGKMRTIEKEIIHSVKNNEKKIEKYIYYI